MKRLGEVFRYDRVAAGILRNAERRPWATVIFFLFLAGASWFFVRQLRVNSDYAKLLPQDYPSVRHLNEVAAKAGGTSYLAVLLECPDFDAMVRLAEAIRAEVTRWPEVKWATYTREKAFLDRYGIFFLGTNDLLEIERYLAEEKRKHSPFSLGLEEETPQEEPPDETIETWQERFRKEMPQDVYQTDADHTTLALTIRPLIEGSNLSATRAFYDRVQHLVAALSPGRYHPEMKVFYAGSLRNRIEVYNTIVRDLGRGTLLSLSGILLVNLLYFRRIKLIVLALIPLVIGLFLSFAIAERVYHELNVISSFLFLIMMGIGIDYSLHLLSRYLHERGEGQTPRGALAAAWRTTGRAVVTSAFTTAGAFLLMVWVHFQGFAQFGSIAFLATILVLVTILVLMPPLILLMERHFPLRRERIPPSLARRLPLPWIAGRRITAFLVLAFVPFGIYGLLHVRFDYDFRSVEVTPQNLEEANERLHRVAFSSATPGAVVLAEDFETLTEAHLALMKRRDEDKTSPTIGKLISLASLRGPVYERKREIIARIRAGITPIVINKTKDPNLRAYLKRLRTEALPPPLSIEEIPEILRNQFMTVTDPPAYILAIYPSVERKDGRKAIAFAHDVRGIRTSRGTLTPAGDTLVLADILQLVIREGKIVLVLSFVAIFLFVLLDFRRISHALWVMVPLFGGFLLLPWLMALFDVSLNFFNVIVLASVVGLGIDNGVHLFHAVLEGEQSGRVADAVRLTFGPVLVCTLTTIAGYSGMLIAHHRGLYLIAILAVLGLGACFIATFLFFPPLLEAFHERRSQHPPAGDSTEKTGGNR